MHSSKSSQRVKAYKSCVKGSSKRQRRCSVTKQKRCGVRARSFNGYRANLARKSAVTRRIDRVSRGKISKVRSRQAKDNSRAVNRRVSNLMANGQAISRRATTDKKGREKAKRERR